MPNVPANRRRLPAVRALAFGVLLLAATVGASVPPESPVADAAMRRDAAAVKQLLKQGADVNAAQGDGMTALHWAAMHNDAELARMLLYAGAQKEATTRNGTYTPLHIAARTGAAAVVLALLEAGANANAVTTAGGSTPLHLAAAQGNAETIKALLDHGAQVNAKEGAWGQTPLMWAAAYDRLAAVQLLLARGADAQATSKVEDIPARERADRAANQLRQRRVAALKAAEQPPRPASAAQQAAAAARDSQVVKMAPNAKPADSTARRRLAADSVARRPADSTARRPAAGPDGSRLDSTSAARGGLGYGDLVGNKGGLTPLLFAVRQGHVESALALLNAGADVNQVSAGDHTSPLLMATINGHFDLARLLLERGADPKLASDAGATPLYATINVQWAAKALYPQPTAQKQQKTTYLELMEALIAAGADVNARLTKHLWYMSYNFDLLGVNTTGATPFWRAAYGTDVPAMKLLIAHGADPSIPTKKPFGRQRGDDAPAEEDSTKGDPSGLAPIEPGGPGVYAIHAASGVGYGEGYAANAHMHAPDGWLPAVKYLVEELHADVNARDHNGYNALHHAAARGDNKLIEYLVSKGADVTAISRRGQTTADMANGPTQRIPPFLETIALLEKLGSKNNHKCKSC